MHQSAGEGLPGRRRSSYASSTTSSRSASWGPPNKPSPCSGGDQMYPQALHQRYRVHKMRNMKADGAGKPALQARRRGAYHRFRQRWRSDYPAMARQLERPALLDHRSVEIYPIVGSCILYFQRKMTGSALISS
jgi:hypothetical protein